MGGELLAHTGAGDDGRGVDGWGHGEVVRGREGGQRGVAARADTSVVTKARQWLRSVNLEIRMLLIEVLLLLQLLLLFLLLLLLLLLVVAAVLMLLLMLLLVVVVLSQ